MRGQRHRHRIPAARQDRIFAPFTPVDPSTTRQYGGSGLGLSICRLNAGHLGGTLTLCSEPGRGSTFTFVVPVGIGAPAGSTPPAPEIAAADVSGLRVLLAEDEPVNRMVALKLLRRLGLTPDFAEDGRQVLELAAEQDLRPRVHGRAHAASRRASRDRGTSPAATGERPEPRIVALTANALPGDRERFLQAGMDDYLNKPVTLDGLTAALGATVAALRGGGRVAEPPSLSQGQEPVEACASSAT